METPAKENIKHNQLLVQQALAAGAQQLAAVFGSFYQEVGGGSAGAANAVHFDATTPFVALGTKVLILASISGANNTVDDPVEILLRRDGASINPGPNYFEQCGHTAPSNYASGLVVWIDTVVPGASHTYGIQAISIAGQPTTGTRGATLLIMNWPAAT